MPNKCIVELETHLGRDVELRFGASGVAVAKLSLPYGFGKWNNETRRWEETMWITGVCFKDVAESCKDFKKGTAVKVVGKLQYGRPWTTRDGQERRDLEIIAESVQLSLTGAAYQPKPGQPQQGPVDDDIPF